MSATASKLSLDEIARRGDDIFARVVKPHLTSADAGRFVAVDIDTEHHEVDDSDYDAVLRVSAKRPGARLWLIRIGGSPRLSYRMRPALCPRRHTRE